MSSALATEAAASSATHTQPKRGLEGPSRNTSSAHSRRSQTHSWSALTHNSSGSSSWWGVEPSPVPPPVSACTCAWSWWLPWVLSQEVGGWFVVVMAVEPEAWAWADDGVVDSCGAAAAVEVIQDTSRRSSSGPEKDSRSLSS